MDHEAVSTHIEELVAEEHRLLEGAPDDATRHERLERVRVELDRYWDLLRQRRAGEEFGLPPEGASERVEGTVQGYRQ